MLGAVGTSSPSTVLASQPASYDDSAWQALLLKSVGAGWNHRPSTSADRKEPPCPALVDYSGLQARPDDLNAYLTILASTGPESTPKDFPGRVDRLAYYINAYNACAIRAVLAEYPTPTVYGPGNPAFEYDWRFQVDGHRLTLHDLRAKAWQAADGDVRTLFALCAAATGSAPLASMPYRPGNLAGNLDAQMQTCLGLPWVVAISHDRQQLQLWSRIVQHRADFFAYYQKAYGNPPQTLLNVVLDLSPPAHRHTLDRAVGYKIMETPFDRRLNDLVVRSQK